MRDHGVAFTSDPTRVRSLLHAQVGGAAEPDVDLLATAADAGITTALVVTRGWATPRLLSDLGQRLVVEQGLSPADARWVVEAWAKALGVKAPSNGAAQTATGAAVSPGIGRRPSSPEVAKTDRSERPRVRQVVSLSLLALVVAVAAVALVLSRTGSGTIGVTAVPLSRPQAEVPAVTMVPAPSVISMTKAQAIDRLEALGLEPEVTTRPSQDAERGTVLRQDPAPGTSLPEGARVVLVVAVPPTRVGTPVGLSFERTPTSVTITWDRPREGSGVDHYEIWRNGQVIGTRHAGRRTFTDAGLSPGSSYLYGVKAIGTNGTQATSRTRTVTLPAAAPASPSPTPVIQPPPVAPPVPPSLAPPSSSPCPAPDPEFCD
ncbi:MAG TPA: PASTA domain-containing protein [Actinomycetota bacterium]